MFDISNLYHPRWQADIINDDFDSHTITSGSFGEDDVGKEFNSGHMGPLKKFSDTFEEIDEFHDFCELHSNMVDTVLVIEEGG